MRRRPWPSCGPPFIEIGGCLFVNLSYDVDGPHRPHRSSDTVQLRRLTRSQEELVRELLANAMVEGWARIIR